jgi:hypothetical protein
VCSRSSFRPYLPRTKGLPERLDSNVLDANIPTFWSSVSAIFRSHLSQDHQDLISSSLALTIHTLQNPPGRAMTSSYVALCPNMLHSPLLFRIQACRQGSVGSAWDVPTIPTTSVALLFCRLCGARQVLTFQGKSGSVFGSFTKNCIDDLQETREIKWFSEIGVPGSMMAPSLISCVRGMVSRRSRCGDAFALRSLLTIERVIQQEM